MNYVELRKCADQVVEAYVKGSIVAVIAITLCGRAGVGCTRGRSAVSSSVDVPEPRPAAMPAAWQLPRAFAARQAAQ